VPAGEAGRKALWRSARSLLARYQNPDFTAVPTDLAAAGE